MKERPIPFTVGMLRALQEGRKTQTRRVVALRQFGPSDTPGYDWTFRGTRRGATRGSGSECWQDFRTADLLSLCPYGVPGDRLWVRETHAFHEDYLRQVGYAADGAWGSCGGDGDGGWEFARHGWISGVAQGEERGKWVGRDYFGRWRSPRFMPRWASRILLEVTGVRVERVQAISEADVLAEGLVREEDLPGEAFPYRYGLPGALTNRTHYAAFARLWDGINAARGHSWESNPWAWAISFRVLTGESNG